MEIKWSSARRNTPCLKELISFSPNNFVGGHCFLSSFYSFGNVDFNRLKQTAQHVTVHRLQEDTYWTIMYSRANFHLQNSILKNTLKINTKSTEHSSAFTDGNIYCHLYSNFKGYICFLETMTYLIKHCIWEKNMATSTNPNIKCFICVNIKELFIVINF